MDAERIWFGANPLPRLALLPAGLLYWLGWSAYLALYGLGIKRAYRARIPVVCVGNLAIGGTGKTPVTLHLIEVLHRIGYDVVLSASGYGAPRAAAASLAPEGPLDPREWGDEPALLRLLAPGVPIVVGRRRVLAAQIAEREFPRAVLLMDDGFQHLPLAKTLSLVLDPARPANRLPLPAGPYREPRPFRARADAVLAEGDRGRDFEVVYSEGEVRSPEGITLAPGLASLLTAIARPERVVATAEGLGFDVAARRLLPDHDPLDAPGLLDGLPGPILTTGKDWVKLSLNPEARGRDFGIVSREARVEPAEAFAAFVRMKIERGA